MRLHTQVLGGYKVSTTPGDSDGWVTEEDERHSDNDTVTDLHESVFGRDGEACADAGNDSSGSGAGTALASDSGSGSQDYTASYADMSSGDTLKSGDYADKEIATQGRSLRSSMDDKILHFAYGSNMGLHTY